MQQTRNTKIRQMEHKNIKRQQIMTDAKAKSKLTWTNKHFISKPFEAYKTSIQTYKIYTQLMSSLTELISS